MRKTLLQLKDICQQFPDNQGGIHKVLDNITCDIKKGDFVSIVGPSGCGKTTLLNLVGGFSKQSSGEILLNNKPISKPNRDRGIVYQDYALFPWMTVLDNIVYGFELEKIDFLEKYIKPRKFHRVKKEAIEKAQFYLEQTGLISAIDKYPHQLSGGMKQRVAIAQAMIMKPQILLMDEPFGALDIQTRESLQIMMLKIREMENNTIFFVTHDLEEAIYVSNRIIVLSQYHNQKNGRNGGAQIVYDEYLPDSLNFLSTEVKNTSNFRHLIDELMHKGFEPSLSKEIDQFNNENLKPQ